MKKFILLLLITFLSLSFISDVQAKRFGGGRSFGVSRSATSSFSNPHHSPISQPMSHAKKWLAPLAGLALGGMLASLFMGHGFAGGILTWVVVLAFIFLITLFIRRKFQPALMNNNNNQYTSYQTANNSSPFANMSSNNVPDQNDFLRQAKSTFIRLQAAYDNKNLNDIRQFTSPQVFGEIQLQIQERGTEVNVTEVVSLQAELTENSHDYRSVRFTGLIKEHVNESPQPFTEIWHFQFETISNDWKVAGIQQELQGEKIH